MIINKLNEKNLNKIIIDRTFESKIQKRIQLHQKDRQFWRKNDGQLLDLFCK